MVFIWWLGVFSSGAVLGWVGRMVFATSNQHRMLKRIEAYYREQETREAIK